MKRNIKCVILDIDGTLTDGKINIFSNGSSFKSFNMKDGLGIKVLLSKNIKVIFLSGDKSKIGLWRAKQLGIHSCHLGIKNKLFELKKILKKNSIEKENVICIGDDDNDLEIIKYVEYSACPNNASENVKKESKFISKYPGGYGAVRDIIDNYILNNN